MVNALMFGFIQAIDAAPSKAEAEVAIAFEKYFDARANQNWDTVAVFVLLKEMKKFLVIKKEFVEKFAQWRFKFAEMVGGKTIVFVFHKKILKSFCGGPNSFFVEKK